MDIKCSNPDCCFVMQIKSIKADEKKQFTCPLCLSVTEYTLENLGKDDRQGKSFWLNVGENVTNAQKQGSYL